MAEVVVGMGGVLRIESDSAEPPFEQVRRQLAEAVGDGRLSSGAKLPPIRALAGELGLAANTVARAYRELEEAGLVLTRGRLGTVAERFNRILVEYQKAPGVTRDRLYLDMMQTVLGNASKVLVDQKSGSLLYLPLDKLIQQSGGTPSGVTVPDVGAAPPRAAAPDAAMAIDPSRSRDALRNRDGR